VKKNENSYLMTEKIQPLKYWFYRYLNRKGIMKTPEGCVMCITDIPFVKKVAERIAR